MADSKFPMPQSDLAGIFYVLVIVHLSYKRNQYITLSISHGMKVKPVVLAGCFLCKNPLKQPSSPGILVMWLNI